MQSYDYANRKGIHPLSWEEIAALAGQLAEQLDAAGAEVIVGIARAGLFPATMVACALRRELYPVRLSRRVNDEVRYARPVWRVPVSDEVAGKVVAVVDEIADTGETLALVRDEVAARGASRVLTAPLISHSWAAPPPTITALVSDELILFPWDQQVLIAGQWQPHPELLAALAAQDGEEAADEPS